MRTTGSGSGLEQRRLTAIQLLNQGRPPADVAKKLGCTAGAVSQWRKKFATGGRQALRAKQHRGPAEKLRAAQRKRLVYLLNHPPTWVGSRWTLKSIGKLVQQEFGVTYDRSSLWHLLQRLGWRCQKPDPRNRTKDAIAQWRAEVYALAAQSKNEQGDLGALSAAMRQLPRPQRHSTWVPREKPLQEGASGRSPGRCSRQNG